MSDELPFYPPAGSPQPVLHNTAIVAAPHTLPLIRLNGVVVLPHTVVSIPLTDEVSKTAEVSKAFERQVLLAVAYPDDDDDSETTSFLHDALIVQTDPNTAPESILAVATLAKIEQIGRLPGGMSGVIVRGISRARVTAVSTHDGTPIAHYSVIDESYEDSPELQQLKLEVHAAIDAVLDLRGDIPQEIRNFVRNIEDPRHLADNTGYSSEYTFAERVLLLTTIDIQQRLRFVLDAYRKQMVLLEVQQRLRQEVEDGTAQQQREFYLRQQLRAIQKELGEDDAETAEIDELRARLASANLPVEARKEADRELQRLTRISSASPEHHVIRTYLEWLADLPWGKQSQTPIDVAHTRAVLDADHYGLQSVKERILEYLAVKRRRSQQSNTQAENGERSREPILCLVGPPGVGKTSLGQSIARALGRNFIRMSLGGVHDEAELRGFRRTYIGSAPGRIIQELRRIDTADPVILLDEVDKLGNDHRGDPASALLEVLDPEQNNTFTDHYLNVPFDLSNVFFIATANTTDTIPGPLRDRLEIIELSSYVEDEKFAIARQHLVNKQMRTNALNDTDVVVNDEAIRTVIQRYTRESGVRGLERQLGSVLRKVARTLEEQPDYQRPVLVDATWAEQALGKARFHHEDRERFQQPGIATGLVWTAVGGDIVYVEAALMTGSKELRITGQLGDVMRESVETALSCIRTRSQKLGIDPHFFDSRALHIHVPGGAVPKDGPSAGITMASALASAATGRAVRDDVAMTGEITLRGRVLPVGGIREKVLGAYRAGIKTIIIPQRNLQDVDDVPVHVREHLEIIAVDSIDQVLQVVLGESPVSTTPQWRIA